MLNQLTFFSVLGIKPRESSGCVLGTELSPQPLTAHLLIDIQFPSLFCFYKNVSTWSLLKNVSSLAFSVLHVPVVPMCGSAQPTDTQILKFNFLMKFLSKKDLQPYCTRSASSLQYTAMLFNKFWEVVLLFGQFLQTDSRLQSGLPALCF